MPSSADGPLLFWVFLGNYILSSSLAGEWYRLWARFPGRFQLCGCGQVVQSVCALVSLVYSRGNRSHSLEDSVKERIHSSLTTVRSQ